MSSQKDRKPIHPKITVVHATEGEKSARLLRGFTGRGTLDERIIAALCEEPPANSAPAAEPSFHDKLFSVLPGKRISPGVELFPPFSSLVPKTETDLVFGKPDSGPEEEAHPAPDAKKRMSPDIAARVFEEMLGRAIIERAIRKN